MMAISPHPTLSSGAPPMLFHRLLNFPSPPEGPLQPPDLRGPEDQFRSLEETEMGLVLPEVEGRGRPQLCREGGSQGAVGGAAQTPVHIPERPRSPGAPWTCPAMSRLEEAWPGGTGP